MKILNKIYEERHEFIHVNHRYPDRLIISTEKYAELRNVDSVLVHSYEEIMGMKVRVTYEDMLPDGFEIR